MRDQRRASIWGRRLPAIIVILVVGFGAWNVRVGRHDAKFRPKIHERVPVPDTYGRLPLTFEENRGQTDARVKFLSRGNGYALFLTSTEAVLKLRAPSSTTRRKDSPRNAFSAIRIRLKGADPTSRIAGVRELAGKSNYLIGRDPKRWHTNVPTFASVRAANVYPGIDVVYRGEQGRLEYDLEAAPHADPSRIKLEIDGARRLALDASRNLVIATAAGEVVQRAPLIYQMIEGQRRIVSGGYVLADAHTAAFKLGAYDHSVALTIDPLLTYASYLGGTGGDEGVSIAVDQNDGSAWVTGTTASTDFRVTPDAFQDVNFGNDDVFITKVSPDGSSIEFSTYAGGSLDDEASDIAVDPTGNAYVTGLTQSDDFPFSDDAFQSTLSGSTDAFVIALDSGGGLIYSTLLGTNASGVAIAVNSVGEAYVVGTTRSALFPTTPGVFQVNYPGNINNPLVGFVTKLDNIGAGLIFSSFLGLSDGGWPSAIALDQADNIFLSGGTSTGVNFGTQTCAPFRCGFAVEMDPEATNLEFSDNFPLATLLGIAVDNSGNAHIIGTRGGPLLINLDSAGNPTDVMLSLNGTPNRIAVGPSSGNIFLSGVTTSSMLAVTPDTYQSIYGGGGDAFVTVVDQSGVSNLYTTYLGGSGSDVAQGIALDTAENIYLTGATQSDDFPVTAGVFQGQHPNTSNGLAFVARIAPVLQSPSPTLTATPTTIATPVPTIFNPPTPSASRSPLATRTPGQTPIGTSTPTTIQTPAPTPVPTPVPTIFGGFTPTPSPTASATQTPTATPTPLPIGEVTIAPAGISFPRIKMGRTSGLRTIRITNPRKNLGPAIITGIALQSQEEDTPATGFTIQTAKSTCSVGGMIPLGKACLIRMTFTPKQVGTVDDTLVITGNFGNSGERIGLVGTGR